MNKTLRDIQVALKAPKGQYNSFGKYKYRSCEDILEAVKPLLDKYGATLYITDQPCVVGERYYIQATAIFESEDGNAAVTAYAREPETKTGMDASQITGTASSYARKYALNGLFLIDDTKDADTDEYHNATTGKPAPKKQSERDRLMAYIKSEGLDATEISRKYGLKRGTTEERFREVLNILADIQQQERAE